MYLANHEAHASLVYLTPTDALLCAKAGYSNIRANVPQKIAKVTYAGCVYAHNASELLLTIKMRWFTI